MSCLHTFRTENKLESQEKVCKNKYFCRIVMPSQKVNIIQFNQYTKSDKMSCIIYADIESLIKKIDKYANNLEESLPKIGDHAPCGYPFLTIWAFDTIANKHSLYCEENWMKKFCSSLREHATNIINFERKKIWPLLKSQNHISMQEHIFEKVC